MHDPVRNKGRVKAEHPHSLISAFAIHFLHLLQAEFPIFQIVSPALLVRNSKDRVSVTKAV